MGNVLGMLGVGTGVLASLLAAGFSPEVLAQFGGLAALGTIAGMYASDKYVEKLTSSRHAYWKANHAY